MRNVLRTIAVAAVLWRAQCVPAADGKSPANPEWLRFRKVDAWKLRYDARVDDSYAYQKGGEQHQLVRVNSVAFEFPLAQASNRNGKLPSWTGTGEAEVSLYTYSKTTRQFDGWGMNKTQGSGKMKAKAVLYLDLEKGTYYVWVNTESHIPVHHVLESAWRAQKPVHDETDYAPEGNREQPTVLWLTSYKKEPLPEKGLRLAGGRALPVNEYLAEHPGKGRGDLNISYPLEGSYNWQLVPIGEEMLEVVIEPKDYEKWVPAGVDGKRAGKLLDVEARLQRTDGKPPAHKAKRFTFELEKVSKEPGVCMNWPMGKPDDSPDLAFEKGVCGQVVEADTAQAAHTPDGQWLNAAVKVSCFDYGAFGQMKVTAEMDDGELIVGHLVGQAGTTRLLIPKRAAGSLIADAWKESAGVTGLADDDDSEKLPSLGKSAGDGFTLYEEYRGFVEAGKHFRGDPKKVDFFVRNYIGGDAVPGIDLFANLTGAEVHHRLSDAEFDKNKRVMNANHAQGPHAVDQHGVYLYTDGDLNGAEAHFSKAGVRGRPVIALNIAVQPRAAATSTMTNENVPASDAIFAYDRAVAHELAHAVGGEHHGNSDYHMTLWFKFADDPENASHKAAFWAVGDVPNSVTDEASGRDLAAKLEPDMLLVRERAREASFPQIQARVREMMKGHEGIASKYSEKEIAEILFNQAFGRFYWYVGAQHGECSGNEQCLMRYSFADAYEKKGTPRAYYYISQKHTERAGLELCRSVAGTGVNDAGRKPQARYGDALAKWGPCDDHIIFNDAIALEPAP